MNKPLNDLPLHSLKRLPSNHKRVLRDAMEMYLDAISVSALPDAARHQEQVIALSIIAHCKQSSFKKAGIPTWTPNWTGGTIKCSFPSYNGQVPTLDLRARLDEFLVRMNKKPKDWKMYAARVDRETQVVIFWAQDVAMKKREAGKRNKLLRFGEPRKGKKKVKLPTREDNIAASRRLSDEEILKIAQARGLGIWTSR